MEIPLHGVNMNILYYLFNETSLLYIYVFCCFFSDKPDPPTDLTLLLVEPFTLSWAPPFTPFASPGVTLSYTVNVTNLNTSRVFSSGELNTPSFNFSGAEDSSPCNVYQFTVTARNAAGLSIPSDTFTASLPSCKNYLIFTYLQFTCKLLN